MHPPKLCLKTAVNINPNTMHVLVLTDSGAASKFISRGLKYENVFSEAKTFKEEWYNYYTFHFYSAVICKMTPHTSLDASLADTINKASRYCPFFIIDYNSKANVVFQNFKQNIYIFPKEISLKILASILKKIIAKKSDIIKPNVIKVCDLELNTYTREVERFGKKHYLRNKEYQLLEYLMTNLDQIITRQKILENVWDRNAELFTNTVDAHIYSLRKKIDFKSNAQLIETIHCTGYIMHSNLKNTN